MAWKAVLFDMDGVLIDSEEYMAKTGVRALKKYGINAKESDFAEFVGCGENRYVGGVAEKYGVPYRTEMKDYLYACYGEHVKEEANIPDGVLEVLHTLRTRGYRLAVCSSADRVKVLMNLSAIGADEALFDHLVTGTDIKNPKPDPEIYLTGAASLGLAPSECIVVEDAPSGIRAAHAAGIEAIGLATSFRRTICASRHKPSICCRDLADPDAAVSPMPEFLPISRADMQRRGWEQCDFVYIIGDGYVDHPSFGHAIISRVLEDAGYKIGIISQPDWKKPDSINALGEPRLGFLVMGGNMDSMVNHYTVSKAHRKPDAYTPGGVMGKRPDYAVTVYCNLIRRTYRRKPIIIGGIEVLSREGLRIMITGQINSSGRFCSIRRLIF